MWEINLADQAVSFGLSLLLGAGCCLFYDGFRLLRFARRFSAAAVFVQDLLYWLVCAFVTFCFLLARSNGEIRSYLLLGMLAGFALCRLTLSPLLLRLLRPVVRLLCRFLSRLRRLLSRFFARLGDVGRRCAAALQKRFKKLAKVLKKGLKPGHGMVYNQPDDRTKTRLTRKEGKRPWRKNANRKKA